MCIMKFTFKNLLHFFIDSRIMSELLEQKHFLFLIACVISCKLCSTTFLLFETCLFWDLGIPFFFVISRLKAKYAWVVVAMHVLEWVLAVMHVELWPIQCFELPLVLFINHWKFIFLCFLRNSAVIFNIIIAGRWLIRTSCMSPRLHQVPMRLTLIMSWCLVLRLRCMLSLRHWIWYRPLVNTDVWWIRRRLIRLKHEFPPSRLTRVIWLSMIVPLVVHDYLILHIAATRWSWRHLTSFALKSLLSPPLILIVKPWFMTLRLRKLYQCRFDLFDSIRKFIVDFISIPCLLQSREVILCFFIGFLATFPVKLSQFKHDFGHFLLIVTFAWLLEFWWSRWCLDFLRLRLLLLLEDHFLLVFVGLLSLLLFKDLLWHFARGESVRRIRGDSVIWVFFDCVERSAFISFQLT